MATPQAPRAPRSPLRRYLPLIAVVAVIAIVVGIIAVAGGGDDKKEGSVTTDTTANSSADAFKDLPVLYSEAKDKGTLDKYTWQEHCDKETGAVAIPILYPPPCVPAASGTNGGETAPGVTADTIKIGYYSAKPDPVYDPIFRAAGAYDEPSATAQAYKNYVEIYSNLYELYGRKIELVKIQGTGGSTDEVAAKADADKAAAAGVFAVLGGPLQSRSFETELARKHVLCLAACVTAAPASILEQNKPYLIGTGGTPEQAALTTTEMVSKQLVGKNAEYAGDELKGKPRSFALLTYDTPDGEYKASWDKFYNDLKDAKVPMVGHVNYFLNPASLAADGRTIATKLKATGATSIIFAGDPIFPSFLTTQMTQQNYFPEWVMSGTVLADTNVFARKFDQKQWAHAFGLQLIPARVPKPQQDAYSLHKWWFAKPPPTDNNYGLIKGYVELMMNGLQLAGPNLSPDTFSRGLQHNPQQKSGPNAIGLVVTYGDHGFWEGDDLGGLDNTGMLYWDPKAVGPDETGNIAPGMYRLVDGGRRYLPGQWPTEPIKLFDPAGTVTVYPANDIPPDLVPKEQPLPPNAPAAK